MPHPGRGPEPPDIGQEPPGVEGARVCRTAGPDIQPEGLRGWTLDLCANAIFNLRKRPVADYEDPDNPPRRRWEFCTVRPIRGSWSLRHGDPCRYQYGRLVKCPDNRWRVLFCTSPGAEETTEFGSHRFSLANFYARSAIGEDPPGSDVDRALAIKPGRTGAMGGYVTPIHTEILLSSAIKYCEPPPI